MNFIMHGVHNLTNIDKSMVSVHLIHAKHRSFSLTMHSLLKTNDNDEQGDLAIVDL